MVRHDCFVQAGGFSPRLTGAAADVDLGLKLRSLDVDGI